MKSIAAVQNSAENRIRIITACLVHRYYSIMRWILETKNGSPFEPENQGALLHMTAVCVAQLATMERTLREAR